MQGVHAGERLKYCRKILKISQKELADKKVSSNLISLIERGKVPLSTVTATLLIDNLNRLSKGKMMDMKLSLKDFLASYEEYIIKLCQGSVNENFKDKDIEVMYERFSNIIADIDKKEVYANVELYFGEVHFKKKNYITALNHFKKAISMGVEMSLDDQSKKADIYYYLGRCYLALEDTERADEYGGKAYQIIKDNKLNKDYLDEVKAMIAESIVEYEDSVKRDFSKNFYKMTEEQQSSMENVLNMIHEYAAYGEVSKIKEVIEKIKAEIA